MAAAADWFDFDRLSRGEKAEEQLKGNTPACVCIDDFEFNCQSSGGKLPKFSGHTKWDNWLNPPTKIKVFLGNFFHPAAGSIC